jgi:acyl-CoA synthetase (AMP-forming)/AMP-acid ligase II
MRIEDLLFDKRYAKETFVCVDEHGEWNYEQMCQRGTSVRDCLNRLKLEKRTTIAVICENSASFIAAFIGILYTNHITVFIDPQLPFFAMKEMMETTGVKAVLASGKRPNERLKENMEQMIHDGITVLFEEEGDWDTSESSIEPYMNDRDENDIAFLLLTSGTTGKSKAAAVTHKAILDILPSIQNYMKVTEQDILYTIKTMVHLHTIESEILIALSAGAKLIALNPLIPISTMLNKINKYKATILVTNTTLLKLLCQNQYRDIDLDNLRSVYISGSLANDEVLQRARSYLNKAFILNSYGLTEAGCVTCQLVNRKYKPGSVGVPLEDVEIAIKNEKGQLCQAGESGKIYVKTKGAMKEYWNAPDLTKQKLVDGYVNTGDLGYLDQDGELLILGRIDDMIVSGAHNVNPNNVEAVIHEYSKDLNIIVFGVEDELLGMRIVCVIEKSELEFNEKAMMKYCAEHMAYYECPHEVYIWKELPRTATGKVSRKKAHEEYLRAKLG